MKRISLIISLIVFTLILNGCSSAPTIKVTDEELDAIAQYSAHLILKYNSYDLSGEKLIDKDDLEEVQKDTELPEEEAVIPLVTPSPVATQAPEDNKQETSTDTETSQPTPSPEPEDTAVTTPLSECLGAEGFNVEYVGYQSCKSYLAENEFYSINAPDGQELLILSFNFINPSETNLTYSAKYHKTKYQLLAGTSSKEPKISYLQNDIQFIDLSLKPGEEADAVLLFFVNPDLKDINLRILGDYSNGSSDKAYNIKIK